MIWGAERRACEVAEEWTRVGPTCGTRWTLSGPVALFFGLALLSLRGRVKALTVLVLLADVVAFGETLAERGVDHVLWPLGPGCRPQADRRPGRFPAVRLSHLEADELPNSGDPQGIGSRAAGQGGRPAGGRWLTSRMTRPLKCPLRVALTNA